MAQALGLREVPPLEGFLDLETKLLFSLFHQPMLGVFSAFPGLLDFVSRPAEKGVGAASLKKTPLLSSR
jgi:hypothetical protein